MGRKISTILAVVFVATALAATAAAQETVNFASVSGRVTDPQGGVIPGATVTARHTETNVTATTTTDDEGRFRFPYLRVGPYDIAARQPGFADAARTLTLGLGAAYELTLSLSVGELTTSLIVNAQADVLETARSQIAGTLPQVEVQSLPMNGRNFLDLALLVPGVSPTNIGSTQLFAETSAVPGQGISIGSQRNLSNNFIVDGLSANDDAAGLSGIPYGVDAVEQFQVVTSGGQAELGRALGGYINVVTKSGTNTLRGTLYGFFRDDAFNAANALSGRTLPMDQQQYGGSLGGAIAPNRTFYFTNFEQRLLDQTGLTTILDQNVPIINAQAGGDRLPRLAGHHRYLSEPGAQREHPRQDRSPDQRQRSAQRAIRGVSRHVRQFPRRWSAECPDCVGRPGQHRSRHRLRQHADDLAEDGQRDSRPVHVRRPRGSTDRPDRTGRQHYRRRLVRHVLEQPDATAQQDVPVRGQPLASGRRARAARRRGRRASTTTRSPIPARPAGAMRSRRWRTSSIGNYSGFSQTFGDPVVSQTGSNIGFHAQDEWKLGSRLTLNLGLRYDLQFLETVNTDTDNVSPRLGFAWSPSADHDLVIRGSAGLFFDRVPLRPVANAILSAGNTTDLSNLQQPSVSGIIPTQAGAPAFPTILPAQLLTTTLVDFTTMNPRPAERILQAGQPRGRALAGAWTDRERRLSIRPRAAPDHVGEPERRHLRRRRHQQRLSPECDVPEQQSVFVGRRIELPRSARLVCSAAGRLVQPARHLYAVEIDEQRRRGVLQLADRSDRHHARLGSIRRRPAPSSRDQRHGQYVDGASDQRVGIPHARISGERSAAVLFGAAIQHHVRCDEPAGNERTTVLGRHHAGGQLRRAHRQSDFAKRGSRERLLQCGPARQPRLPAERQRDDSRVSPKSSI